MDGYFARDLDTIPDLPPHTELIDGGLVIAAPQTVHRMRVLRLFESGLEVAGRERYAVQRGMTVTLGPKQRLEPDIMITWAAAEKSLDQSDFAPEDVLLVVEIVSAESRVRDRERKPQLYAQAGIRVFWRVERDEVGNAVVYAYELDPATEQYVPTGIHRDRITAAWPFPIDIDLTSIELPTK